MNEKPFMLDLTLINQYINALFIEPSIQGEPFINKISCMGVWFGMPCGTATSARRHDGTS